MTRRAPSTLGVAGKALFRQYTTALNLDEAEEFTLLQACKTADELEAMETLFGRLGDELVAEGYNGNPRPHPLITQIRQHRELLIDLLDRIKVAD